MGDNAEEGIFRAQATAARAQGDRLGKQHKRSVAYLDERILTMLFAIALLGLIGVWATATSQWVIYGSFAAVIGLTMVFGYMRVKRIERVRIEREEEAKSWQSASRD